MVTTRPLGHATAAIHRRCPATAQRGGFWLLGFPPGPVRPSLDDLETSPSGMVSISTPSLARTPDQHAQMKGGTPNTGGFHHPAPQ